MPILEGQIDIDEILNQIERIPAIKEVSQEFDKDLIEAFLLAVLDELRLNSPRLDHYRKIINSSPETVDFNKAQRIIENIQILSNRFHHGGAGLKITAQRLALTSHFVSYDHDG